MNTKITITIIDAATSTNSRRNMANVCFCANVQKRISELGMEYIRSINTVGGLAETKEDLDLLISATKEMYLYKIDVLKETCRLHHIPETEIALLFKGIGL